MLTYVVLLGSALGLEEFEFMSRIEDFSSIIWTSVLHALDLVEKAMKQAQG